MEENSLKMARERALRLLSQRAYTEQGLYEALCRRVDEESAAQTVRRMRELGLLDDEDYAKRFASDCQNRNGYGARRIAMELSKKGIDKELISQTLSETEEDARPAIAKMILKRYNKYVLGEDADEKGYRKTVDALVRRGYRHSDVRAVIENLRQDEDYYEE